MQYATCFIMPMLLMAMESRKMALSKVFLLETGSPWTICLRGIKYAATRLMGVCCTFLLSKTYLISSGSNSVPHMDIEGGRYGFPLFAALAHANENAVKALLI